MRISLVMPAFNEEATLARVVLRALGVAGVSEIVIVNDGSDDRTGAIADELARAHSAVRVIHQPRNLGKAEALRTGIAATGGEIVIIQDADLEYDPRDIPELVQPIVDGEADVVFGSRFLVRRAARVLYFYHYLANKALTFLSNLLTNVNMTDIHTGYKAFRGEVIRSMRISGKGFGADTEIAAKVAKLGCAIYEVPISYHGRTYAEGKKVGAWDGVVALWYILRFNLFCTRKGAYTSLPRLARELQPASGLATAAARHDQAG